MTYIGGAGGAVPVEGGGAWWPCWQAARRAGGPGAPAGPTNAGPSSVGGGRGAGGGGRGPGRPSSAQVSAADHGESVHRDFRW